MAKLGPKLSEHRAVILTALLTQLAAALAGMAVIYSCTRGSPYVEDHFRNAIYWGIVGPPALMFVGAPAAVAVIGFLCVLFFLGLRWRTVRFLWFVGILLWGTWWVLLTYASCISD